MQLNPVPSLRLLAYPLSAQGELLLQTRHQGRHDFKCEPIRSRRAKGLVSSRWIARTSFLACLAVIVSSGSRRTARCFRGPVRVACAASTIAEEAGQLKNVAMVFVKPHAYTSSFLKYLSTYLEGKGISVLRTGDLKAAEIDEKGIIDEHYKAISDIGMCADAKLLEMGSAAEEKFEKAYGKPYAGAIASGEVHTAVTALAALKVSPTELLDRCLAAGYEKLRSGLYCAKLEDASGTGHVYVMNGFYARMREKFTAPGSQVRWYVVEFDPTELTWDDFRSSVIGSTKPDEALPGSLRAELCDRWEEFGLKTPPNYQDNGVHASAGPLEAVKERSLWAGDSVDDDPFVSALHAAGIKDVLALMDDPKLTLADDTVASAFDATEGKDTSAAVDLLSGASIVACQEA